MVGIGYPMVVIVKLLNLPEVKVVLLALVIVGASLTVRVKVWLTVPALLLAVMVSV